MRRYARDRRNRRSKPFRPEAQEDIVNEFREGTFQSSLDKRIERVDLAPNCVYGGITAIRHECRVTPGVREKNMKYIEINDAIEIGPAIETIRQACGGLNNAVFAAERETTMRGNQVMTVFFKFEAVLKIEAEESLIDRLLVRVEERKAGK